MGLSMVSGYAAFDVDEYSTPYGFGLVSDYGVIDTCSLYVDDVYVSSIDILPDYYYYQVQPIGSPFLEVTLDNYDLDSLKSDSEVLSGTDYSYDDTFTIHNGSNLVEVQSQDNEDFSEPFLMFLDQDSVELTRTFNPPIQLSDLTNNNTLFF